MAKSLIEEIGRERAEKLMGDAIAEAAAESDALGVPQIVNVDGAWCRKYPDGRIEPIGQGG